MKNIKSIISETRRRVNRRHQTEQERSRLEQMPDEQQQDRRLLRASQERYRYRMSNEERHLRRFQNNFNMSQHRAARKEDDSQYDSHFSQIVHYSNSFTPLLSKHVIQKYNIDV